MSKLSIVYISILIMISFCSCDVDVFEDNEYNYPEAAIETISQNFDTTFVQFNATKVNDPIELIGLAYKAGETPKLRDNQQVFGGTEGIYVLPIIDLEPEEEYFFNAFAGNGYAYGESEPVSFTVPLIAPIVPCELTQNVITFNGVTQAVSSINFKERDDEYIIEVSTGSISLDIEFRKAPTSDVYTTTTDFFELDTQPRLVSMDIIFGQFRVIKDFQKVYVDKIGENQYSISFCELDTQNNSTMILKGNIRL